MTEKVIERKISPVLDERWYRRFQEIGTFNAVELFQDSQESRNAERDRFISGQVENPTLDYPKINLNELAEQEQGLLELKKEILDQEENETVRQLYRWKINEKLAEARMIRAAANGDMRKFEIYNKFLFGEPSTDIYLYTIYHLRQEMAEHMQSDNPDLAVAAKDIYDALPWLEGPSRITPPNEEVAKNANRETLSRLPDIVNLPDQEGDLNPEQIQEIFIQALEAIQAEGWEVVIDGDVNSYHVNQRTKKIKINPNKRLAVDKVRGTVAHEINTHVARREKGERSKLMLLGLGLDRYIKGEEGLATMSELAAKEKTPTFKGSIYHLAVALARGVDGQKRNFRQVYEILEKYYYYRDLKNGKPKEETTSKAKRLAWYLGTRVFRGSDCKTPGACYPKDMVYQEGHVDVWRVIGENQGEMARFQVGKYDPANNRHILILEQLGITDEDLKMLES